MSRIRSLKPEFGHNDKLSALPAEAHLLAGLLITYADDEGYFNANPKLVHAGCCPLRELLTNISDILTKLSGIGYLELFKGSDGRDYGFITNFHIHQRVTHPTASKIKILRTSHENIVRTNESFGPDLGRGIDLGTRKGKEPPIFDDLKPSEAASMFLHHEEVNIPATDFELRDTRAGIEAIMGQEKLICKAALDWAIGQYRKCVAAGKKVGPGWMRRAGYNDPKEKRIAPMVNAVEEKRRQMREAGD
jgi:hypothetical protein